MMKRLRTKIRLSILAPLLLMSGCGGAPKTATPTPEALAPTPEPTPQANGLEEIAVGLVTDLAKGDYVNAATHYPYDDKMKSAINEKVLEEQIWGSLVNTYGAFKEIAGTKPSNNQGFDIISVRTLFENGRILINVLFDKQLVAGINFSEDTDDSTEEMTGNITDADDSTEGKTVNFTEEVIIFGKTDWELPGTLTLPKNASRPPVVVLIHGSGSHDRDATIGPNKPFRDIAWQLAEQGVATLRFDKRTQVHGNKFTEQLNFTVFEESVEDALLAVAFLKARKDIDPNRIYVLGHSLGGMLIPRIAPKTPNAAGYIILAGAVTPLEDLIVQQLTYLSELDGSLSDQEKQTLSAYESMRDNVKQVKSKEDTAQMFGVPAAYWLDLKGYNPAVLTKEIQKPLLILQGERDYQVTMAEFELWKQALNGKDNVTFIAYPALNHFFIPGTGKSSPEEYQKAGQVEPQVTRDIASFILK